MKYPDVLKIEITNHCNAKCVFCNNIDIKNKSHISIEDYEKILKAFPEAKQVQPQWFGEPMVHPEFGEIIKLSKKYRKQLVFYTNASLIEKHYEQLKRMDKKDIIIISIEGRKKDVYESLRVGLSWEKLKQNIEYLKNLSCIKKIRITNCLEIKDDINNIVKYWQEETNWKVIVADEKPFYRNIKGVFVKNKCKRPTNHFTVNVYGQIRLCCTDYQDKKAVNLGDINTNDIRKLWELNYDKRNCQHDICKKCYFKFNKE